MDVCLFCGSTFFSAGASHYCCSGCQAMGELPRPIPREDSLFLHLDQERDQLHLPQKPNSFVAFVEGLHCPQCISTLENLSQYNDDVLRSKVDYGRSLLEVELSPQGKLSSVAALVTDLGYRPHFLNPNQSPQSIEKEETRDFLKRLGVAGACAGNIMLFTIPIYAGLEGTLGYTFAVLSFLLFLPVLFYSSTVFYKGAWAGLKFRKINIDIPIVIALWLGFIMSTVNLARGSTEVYYDSTASFLFLILTTRFFVKKAQQRFLLFSSERPLLQESAFWRLTDKPQWISPSQIQVGDVLQVKIGQTLPADGVLVSPWADMDMSLFNGESVPKTENQGSDLFAGTKALTSLKYRVTKTGADSRLGILLEEIRKDSVKKSLSVTRADQLAQILIGTVLALAALAFFYFSSQGFTVAFNRSLALIVIACPCALALGTPLTYALALRKAFAEGLLIKSADVFEKLSGIKNIFLDKTGTLTETGLSLIPSEVSTEIKSLVLGLESQSSHPIAYAFRRAWKEIPIAILENKTEMAGSGVSGYRGQDLYTIRKSTNTSSPAKLSCTLYKNETPLAHFSFTENVSTETMAALRELQKNFSTVQILSGDRKESVLGVTRPLNIPDDHAHAEKTPEEKKTVLEKSPHSVFIGDGANDALAFQSADVSVAVSGSVELSLKNADIYLMQKGLEPFVHLLDLAKVVRQTLRRNFVISLTYNLVGAVLALAGLVNPLVAALLMPASSLIILASTLWRLR